MPGGAGFRFNLLGPFAVFRGGVRMADQEVGSRKGRTLLKLLLIERDHMVPSDRIAEVLWDDSPPPRWERDVATLVSRLRSVFGADAIAGGAGGYAFARSDRFEIDLDTAERLITEAEERLAVGEPSLARSAADGVAELFVRGSLLEEEPYADWVSHPRIVAGAILRRARRCEWQAAIQVSDWGGAAIASEAAIEADPLDEEACR
ncbi:MAG TPA: hypothetical protein VF972_11620, partial [Actinomycetota bacterium]